MRKDKEDKIKNISAIIVLLYLTAMTWFNFGMALRIHRAVEKQIEVQHWMILKINELERNNIETWQKRLNT